MKPIIALLSLLAATSPLAAETAHPARLQPGDLAVMTHDWNHKTDIWGLAGPDVNTACFKVLEVNGERTMMELVTGFYHPWWSEVPLKPGFRDEWIGNTEAYLEARPDAAPRELTHGLFTTVESCPLPRQSGLQTGAVLQM